MGLKVRTQSGSIYLINIDTKRWARVREPEEVGKYPLRTEDGSFLVIGNVKLGERMEMLAELMDDKKGSRLITTSMVVEIQEIEWDGLG